MRKSLRLIAAILLIVLLCPCAACLESLPLDEFLYVLDLGVEEGETLTYNFVFMVSVSVRSGDSSNTSVQILSSEGRDLFEAVEALSAVVPKKITFSRMTLLVFSENLARGGDIPDILDFDEARLKIRDNIRVLISSSPMKELFECMISENDPSMSKLKSNLENNSVYSGTIVDRTLRELRFHLKDKICDVSVGYCAVNAKTPTNDMVSIDSYPFVAGGLLVEGSMGTSLIGTAVFNGSAMVGVLDGQNTCFVMMVTDEFTEGRVWLKSPDGDDMCVLLTKAQKPRVRVSGSIAYVECFLTAKVDTPKLSNEIDEEQLILHISRQLKSRADAVFDALKDKRSDVYSFGAWAVMNFSDTEAWESYDWKSVYSELQCEFVFTLKLA